MTVQGIDVSSFQSTAYDTSGLDFVFIKATEGTSYVNPKQAAQAAHARAAGCVVGFYHFLHPGNVAAQAEYFVERCVSQPGDILACDWEPTSSGLASNADKDGLIKAVKKLRPGHRSILYCDLDRWTHVDTTSYCGDGLWIADPNHPAGHPAIKGPWRFHQFGIRGTDRDVAAFPSRAALAAWAAGTTPKETDMQLTDVVKLSAWVKKTWPKDKGLQDDIEVNTAIGSGYAHARIAHENTTVLLAQVSALAAAVQALARDGGLPLAQVQAAAEAGAKAALAQLGDALTKED